jgi:hypothetical protein
MASVSGFSLDIQVVNNGPNLEANITVDYDIDFSSYDQHSNQSYSEVCRLVGKDTVITPPEDGVDDAIPGGQLLPVPVVIDRPPLPPIVIPGLSIVQSDGRTSLHRHLTKTLPLSALNEDQPSALNPDEIRAQVVLTPNLPVAVTRESNQVALNIN